MGDISDGIADRNKHCSQLSAMGIMLFKISAMEP